MAYESILLMPDPNNTVNGPGYISLELDHVIPGMKRDLNNGGTITISFKGSYWVINIQYPELTPEEAQVLRSHVSKVRTFKDFYISVPGNSGALGSDSFQEATGQLSIGASANELSILTEPNYNNLSYKYSPGDMLKISNSHKVYEVADVFTRGVSTIISLDADIIETEGLASASLEPCDIKFRVKYTKPPKFKLNRDGLYEPVSVSLKENII